MYLVRGKAKEAYPEFTERMMNLARETAAGANPIALKVTLTSQAPPAFSIIPFKKSQIAVFSVYKDYPEAIDLLKKTDGLAVVLKSMKQSLFPMKKPGPTGNLRLASAC